MRTMLKLLATHGFVLNRQRKHQIFKHGDGRVFVICSTQSDYRAEQNALNAFARLVGRPKRELLDELRGASGRP